MQRRFTSFIWATVFFILRGKAGNIFLLSPLTYFRLESKIGKITEMEHETCYVSCSCNQTPTSAHWGDNNLICYGACNAVLIYDPKVGLCHLTKFCF